MEHPPLIELTHEPIAVDRAVAYLVDERCGGQAVFLGTTRRWTDGRETETLDYEAYEPMALSEMRRLVESAAAKWSVHRAVLIHRLGRVGAGEASVLVGVATPHRADAFAACRYLIDTLKARVPIWKKERYADGTTEWVRGTLPKAEE